MSLTPHEQIRVLHVDDEPSLTDLTATFLEREDDRFTVETATSAVEGLERINDRPPDCIISDFNMPGMDGLEFLSAVREDDPGLPFILFTGKGSEAVASEAIAADVTDYLQKGTGSEQYELLANRIRNAVQARRETQRVDRQEELMRLTELAGDTGGFEIRTETGEMLLTDGVRRIIDLPAKADLSFDEGIDMYHPEDREPIRQTIDRARQTGEQTHGTWRLQTEDGDERLVDVTFTPETTDGDAKIIRGAIHDITDRRERQRDLKQIETLFEHAHDTLFLVDVGEQFTLERVNPAIEDATGASAAELQGQTPKELFGEQQGAAVEAKYCECVERRELLQYDEQLSFGEQPTHWETKIAPVVIDGTVEYIAGSTRDVTDQKERQQQLDTERRFIQQALDSLDDFFYVLDTDGTLRRWNEKVLEITGYSESELDGMPAIELFPEDEHETVGKSIETTLADGETLVNANLLTADGQRIPYEFTGGRLTDGDGTTTGLVGVGRNLTERRQRERRFRALVEESNDVISIIDTEARYQYQSPSLERILGHDPEETVGDKAWEYIHPDDRERVAEVFEKWVTTGETPEPVEYRARHADGSWRWMEAHGNNQLDNPAADGYAINSRDITDRRERQQELERTHDLMANMEQLADVGAWEYDPETDRLMLTDGTRRIHGLEQGADLTVEAAFETIHPDDRDLLEDRFDRCLETGEPYEMDVRLTTPDGGQRWIATHGERVTKRDSGDVVRGYIQDVTEQKQMERDLRQERDLVTGIVEATPVGIAALNADGQLSFANETASTIGGWPYEEVKDMSYNQSRYDIVNEDGDSVDAGDTTFSRVMSQETPIHNQVMGVCRPSGERVWLSVSGVPQYDDDGELERAVFAFEDITEERELEAELSDTLGRISDAFFALDEAFRVTQINGRAEELLEASEEELLGETLWDMYPETEEDDKVWDSLHTAMDTQTPQSLELCYEPRDDWFEVTVYPSETGLSVYFRDVTEQKEYERKLEAQNERLEKFASVISHDLRSPLSIVGGHLELAQETCESDHLAQAADALDRSQALIDDLSTLAREGETVGELEPVGLADVAENSWRTVETGPATLEADISQVVRAHSSRLRELLENLYRNAVEHSGDDLTVSVGLIDDGFYVADTGPGIPESDHEQVFDAGYSTTEDGTGFGLRIVDQIVDAHGWEITVTESEQGGARFEITGVAFADR